MTKYHTFWKRLGAALIDGLILYPLTFIDNVGNNSSNSFLFSLGILISALLYILYFIILHGRYGQTLGKKAMHIKIIDINEVDFIGYKRAALRELPWILTTATALIFMFWSLFIIRNSTINTVREKYADLSSVISFVWILVELFTMFTNPKRRAIHDWIAKSVVLKIKN